MHQNCSASAWVLRGYNPDTKEWTVIAVAGRYFPEAATSSLDVECGALDALVQTSMRYSRDRLYDGLERIKLSSDGNANSQASLSVPGPARVIL